MMPHVREGLLATVNTKLRLTDRYHGIMSKEDQNETHNHALYGY